MNLDETKKHTRLWLLLKVKTLGKKKDAYDPDLSVKLK